MLNIFNSHDGKVARYILQKLSNAGYEAFLVGGCVRNFILGLPIVDFDITTSAKPDTVISLFPKTLQTGIRFGTVTVVEQGVFIEVTTFRSEADYEDTRHPSQIRFETSVLADLERRDFTMNAIACAADGTLIDPFSGRLDIDNQVIRCVGDPLKRMNEDLLRCIRAFRFATQLGFVIETETLAAIRHCSPHLVLVARERIATEWHKMLLGSFAIPLATIAATGWMPAFDRTYTDNDYPQWQKFLSIYKKLTEEAGQLTSLAILLGKSEASMISWLQTLRYGREMVRVCTQVYQAVTALRSAISYKIKDQTFKEIQELLFRYDLHTVLLAVVLINLLFHDEIKNIDIQETHVMQLYQQMPIQQPSDLAITGNDIMEQVKRPGGPWLGQLLQQMTEHVLHGELANDRQKLLQWVHSTVNRTCD